MRLYFLGIFVGLSLIAGFVLWVDPLERWREPVLFESAIPPGSVALLRSGESSNRLVKLSLYKVSKTPEVLFMGSSRVMTVAEEMLPKNVSIFNLGISGGSIEEYALFWNQIKETGRLPEKILLYLESFTFNRGATLGNKTWLKKSKNEPMSLKSFVSKAKEMKEVVLDALRWELVLAAFNKLRLATDKIEIVAETDRPKTSAAYRRDGSMIYPETFLAERTVDKVRQIALNTPDPKVDYQYLNYSRNEDDIRLLEETTKDILNHNVQIMLVVSPIHPLTFERLSKHPTYGIAVTDYKDVLATLHKDQPKVQICDLLDPQVANCDESEFMDGHHMLASCDQKVLDACFSKAPEWASLRKR